MKTSETRSLRLFLATVCVCLVSVAVPGQAARPTRIAVLDLGNEITALRAAAKLRETLRGKNANSPTVAEQFEVIDPDQSRAAASGIGLPHPLNMTLTEARDLGAAIGCDFYVVGEADTVLRSPLTGPSYYESYAALFLVSARTGRLELWGREEYKRPTAEEAQQLLLGKLGDPATRELYRREINRALETERDERVQAVESGTPIIEVLADDQRDEGNLRAPRPYRRLKPEYPYVAAQAEVEATVDIMADINSQGEVGRIEIVRWAGYGLDQSVTHTVKQMHFFPAQRDGVPIPIRVLLRYNFRKPPRTEQPK